MKLSDKENALFQSVSLIDIVSNFMLETKMEGSLLYRYPQHMVIQKAKRLIQELGYDAFKTPKCLELEISDIGTIPLPPDYVEYIGIYLVDENGTLYPLNNVTDVSNSVTYLIDTDGNIIVDNEGYIMVDEGSRRETFVAGKEYAIVGGCQSYGSYIYDPQSQEFLLQDIPSRFSKVVLKYNSDPVLGELRPENVRVHKYVQSALEAGLYYKCIEMLKYVSMGEKAMAEKRFKQEQYKAKCRFLKKSEVLQALKRNNR